MKNNSWLHELDIAPAERFLHIQDLIPFTFPKHPNELRNELYKHLSADIFKQIQQEFGSLIRDNDNKNILSVSISYVYGNILLPKCYEVIFDVCNPERYWEQKSIVKYAYNNRHFFHADLWRGHSAHILLEVIGDIPKIFGELGLNDGGKNLHSGIGLCTKYDWPFIKEYLQKKTSRKNIT